MLIHNVFFWLRKDISDADRAIFDTEARLLSKISYLEQGFGGAPAPTEKRPVIDHSFDYAICLHFKTLADHEFYQKECLDHARFVTACKTFWERVIVYDIDPIS